MHTILSNEELAPGVHRLWVHAPVVARKRRAGQFAMVRIDDDGERIPLTIADVDAARGAVAFIVQSAGKTTRCLNTLAVGEALTDVVGPLGRPTHIRAGARVCCVGGGIGVAVLFPIAAAFRALGGDVVSIIGARTADLVLLEDELRRQSSEVTITTEDGTRGAKGLVTDALRERLARAPAFDEVVAAGPLPMMRAVCEVTRPLGIRTTVSLNPVMVDGTGMCGGCRVSVGGEQRFVCVDGPEFDGHLVNFDELAARLRGYRELELASLHRYQEELEFACRAMGTV